MNNYAELTAPNKIPTGIEGFEHITMGGLTEGRTSLITGSSGSGKTLFTMEFIYRGVNQFKKPSIFVTFEEKTTEIIRNVKRLNWNFEKFINQKKLKFIDVSPEPDLMEVTGSYDLSGLLSQIKFAVEEIDAKLLVMDSIGGLFSQFDNPGLIRR